MSFSMSNTKRAAQRSIPDYLVAGAAGGGAPPLVLLATSWTLTNNPELPEVTFLIGVLVLGAIGLFVVWVTEEKDRKRAFFVGLGLPAMMNGVLSQTTLPISSSDDQPSHSTSGPLGLFVGSAYAQAGSTESTEVLIRIVDDLDTVAVVFLDNEGRTLSNTLVSRSQIIPTPPNAASIRFVNPAYNSFEAKLQSIGRDDDRLVVRYKVGFERKLFSGFLVAMGATGVRKYSLTADRTAVASTDVPPDTDVRVNVAVSRSAYTQLPSISAVRLDANRAIAACVENNEASSEVSGLKNRVKILEQQCRDASSEEKRCIEQVTSLRHTNATLRDQLAMKAGSFRCFEESGHIVGRIYFATNKDEPRTEGLSTLELWAEYLTNNADVNIALIGHADANGASDSNLDLSSRRVAKVKGKLSELGVDPGRIQLSALGEDVPAVASDAPSSYALNRRVEIVLD